MTMVKKKLSACERRSHPKTKTTNTKNLKTMRSGDSTVTWLTRIRNPQAIVALIWHMMAQIEHRKPIQTKESLISSSASSSFQGSSSILFSRISSWEKIGDKQCTSLSLSLDFKARPSFSSTCGTMAETRWLHGYTVIYGCDV